MRRREVLTGAATALVGRAAFADEAPPRAFRSGPLAANPLAENFSPPPAGLRLPDIALRDAEGRPRRFVELLGRPALVSLWAEWCTPCLAEAHDLAALAEQAPPGVTVLAALTASVARLDGLAAHERLVRVHAGALPTWVEPDGGDRLLTALAGGPMNRGGQLPCTLIVDREGRVRGRMLGARFQTVAFAPGELGPGGRLSEAGKRRLEATPSILALPSGAALLRLLADGALDRVSA